MLVGRCLRLTSVVVLGFLLVGVPLAKADDGLSKAQWLLLHDGVNYFDTDACATPQVSSQPVTASPGPVYVLGDSITSQGKASLQQALDDAHIGVTQIDGVGSRSFTSPGVGKTDGLEAIDADKDDIAKASTVIIALGTNKDDFTKDDKGNPESKVFKAKAEAAVAKIRNINVGAKIYWVNIFSESPPITHKGAYNAVIGSLANVTVIDADKNPAAPIKLGDGVHPEGSGFKAWADTIVQAISGSGGGSPLNSETTSSCQCSDDSVGGPSEGGPLTGVHFPQLDDTAKLAQVIDNYIKKGWPDSPLVGYGAKFVEFGQKYDVNPTISVIIAQVEYQFGTLTQYVGKGAPGQYNFWAVTHDSGNGARFGAYPSIEAAMEEHFKLLGGGTYIGAPANFTTISQIMNRYAPSFENDTPKYIRAIQDGVRKLMADAGGSTYDPTSLPNSACNAEAVAGGAAAVNSDGYAFPLAAKKKGDYKTFGALSPLPCNNSGGCHHPFKPRGGYAFDMGVSGFADDSSQGAPVYAITDGVMVSVDYQRNGGACNQFEFKSDRDGYVYWYGHLAPDASVKPGQHYKAGQQVGKVGPSRCADNTAPHLHIDRGYPKGAPGGYESARDEGIIPLMNKLYSELPD